MNNYFIYKYNKNKYLQKKNGGVIEWKRNGLTSEFFVSNNNDFSTKIFFS